MIRCEMKQNCLKLAFDGSYANLNVGAKTPPLNQYRGNTNGGGGQGIGIQWYGKREC